MARFSDPRKERLAWALAMGLGRTDASRLAGFEWGGHAWTRCQTKEMAARVDELKPLVAAGAGPDDLSQVLTQLVVAAVALETPEALEAAARIAVKAQAAKAKVLAAGPPPTPRRAKKTAKAQAPAAPTLAEQGPDVTLDLETWLRWTGARVVEA